MTSKLNKVSKLYKNIDETFMQDVFDVTAKNFEKQFDGIEDICKMQHGLLKTHFNHQKQVVAQTMKPFLSKIS